LQDSSYIHRLLCGKWSYLNVEPGYGKHLKYSVIALNPVNRKAGAVRHYTYYWLGGAWFGKGGGRGVAAASLGKKNFLNKTNCFSAPNHRNSVRMA